MRPIAIINGQILDPSQNVDRKGTLLVEEGRITGILSANEKLSTDYEKIDAKGCVVSAGFIDLHTHLRDPGFEYREDIVTGTQAAAAGGFTTIVCMANTNPVNDNRMVTEYIRHKVKNVGMVEGLPVGAVSRGLKGAEMADIGEMVEAGIVAISDDGEPVMSGSLMRRAMEYAKSFDIFTITHAEDKTLSRDGSMHEGPLSCHLGLGGIPAIAEETMIFRDIGLAKLTGGHLHVAHVSTAGGIAQIQRAKKEGLPVTCEVTPHHLFLTDQACADYNTDAKVNPPLRTLSDNKALLKAINDGVVDAIATDHAPHAPFEKQCCMDEAHFGLIGMETALPILLSFVHKKQLTMKRLIQLLTTGPARVLKRPLGTLKKGSEANITIFDPNRFVVLGENGFASKSQNTPFRGLKMKGKVRYTMVRGKKVFINSL